mmetsp:Transcript_68870/g.138473  ORF Transcript_68870/g.138473 Transcript_68870/m.138473 type:complete len:587 (+) Transcript_68870:125-1885(+)
MKQLLTSTCLTGTLLYALLVRFIAVFVVELVEQGGLTTSPTYTDVDYHVISDAGALFLNGYSPYDRPTFRYPPILAFIGALNHLIHPTVGKLIFSVVDVIAGAAMYAILVGDGVDSSVALDSIRWLWLFNPVVVNISTRGSADVLPCCCTLLSILGAMAYVRQRRRQEESTPSESPTPENLELGRMFLCCSPLVGGSVAHGIGIHLKIYPIIFLPAFLAFLGPFLPSLHRCTQSSSPQISRHLSISSFCWLWVAQATKRYGITPEALLWLGVSLGTAGALTAASSVRFGSSFWHEAVAHHFSRADHRHNYSIWWLALYLVYDDDVPYSQSQHELSSTGVGMVSDGGGSRLHMGSSSTPSFDSDVGNRSAGFESAAAMSWRCRALGLGAMVPQAAAVLLAAHGLLRPPRQRPTLAVACKAKSRGAGNSNDTTASCSSNEAQAVRPEPLPCVSVPSSPRGRLPLCLFVTAAAFVHLNKVVTAQYLVWYLSLFPLVWPHLDFKRAQEEERGGESRKGGSWKPKAWEGAACACVWALSLVGWLGCAYALEFRGCDVWIALWAASLVVFASSITAIAVVLKAHVALQHSVE